jgi:hypothetical protein
MVKRRLSPLQELNMQMRIEKKAREIEKMNRRRITVKKPVKHSSGFNWDDGGSDSLFGRGKKPKGWGLSF